MSNQVELTMDPGAGYVEEGLVAPFVCRRCGVEKTEHDANNKHLCRDCAKLENNRYSYLRTANTDWMKLAIESGLDVWLQQPNETQWEYSLWSHYRDQYPGKKPSFRDVARDCCTTYNVVTKASARWSWAARMQAWMTECDRLTMAQRTQEILDMNKEYISLSQRLRSKASQAIDSLSVEGMSAQEITSLLKTAEALERKAHTDSTAQATLQSDLSRGDENPELKKSKDTDEKGLQETLAVLLRSGALGSITQVGVRETTTKETVLMGTDDTSIILTEEGDD